MGAETNPRGYLAWDDAPAITGWRYWILAGPDEDAPALLSPYRRTALPPYPCMTAVCDLYDHDAANPRCYCGFTSAYQRADLVTYLHREFRARVLVRHEVGLDAEPGFLDAFDRMAIGRVDAPGRRVPAHEGAAQWFRHRWLSLQELFVPAPLAVEQARLADHYNVPVTVGSHSRLEWLEELASGFNRGPGGCVFCGR